MPEILVAGGDGTVHEVVEGLLDAEPDEMPVLTILPLGTGNDLARSLEVPREWTEALDLRGGPGTVRELDLMEMELDGHREVAVNAVVVGNGGRVGEVLDDREKARWGPLSYLRSAMEVAFELEPVEVRLALDDGKPETMAILNVVVANGRYAGGGVPIAPRADPHDGRLEVVTVLDTPLRQVLGMLPTLLREEDPEHPSYRHRTAGRVAVETVGDRPLPVSVDGENVHARSVSVTLTSLRIPVRVRRP